MKTADLIPFILLELNEKDKYGFELTKAIENKSNGQIVIKQPTLYTLLKKLEKSKFIASYWQDSEIGGKRHYYKLTQNGRLQVSTLPSFEFLLQNALKEENDELTEESASVEPTQPQEEKRTSIMDELTNNPSNPSETILPSDEVFEDDNIDLSTELEINVANAEILKQEQISTDEQFATNENVSKFTEKIITTPTIINNSTTETDQTSNSILDIDFAVPKSELDIKFVDYVDFKNTDSYKKSKIISTKLLWQVLATSGSLVVMTILCSIITSFTGRSGLYYFFFISSLLVALFYPIIYAINMDKVRIKYQNTEYICKTKYKSYLGITLLLAILIICVVVNITIGKNTIGSILTFKNFASFYAPLLLTSVYFLDVLYNHLFCSKINK